MISKLQHYALLIRLHKPIGIFLLLWPTLWALWLAAKGIPSPKIFFIFVMGVILMRSAGCAINDFADQHFDLHVSRTKNRPLTSKKISSLEALSIFTLLSATAFSLTFLLNTRSVLLAIIGFILVVCYPFLKRVTHLPQIGLGIAFSWGIPMAFAAQTNTIPFSAWILFLTSLIWPIIYDTLYAMADRTDDLKIGVKSTAILFGELDTIIVALLQFLFIAMMIWVGYLFDLHNLYYFSLGIVAFLFCYQQWLIKDKLPANCFQGFLQNHWVGFMIFIGICAGLRP